MSVSLLARLSFQCSPSMSTCKASASTPDSASAFTVLSHNQVSVAALPPPVSDVAPPLCRLLALSFCSIAAFGPFQAALAETVKQPNEEVFVSTRISQCPYPIVAEISPLSSAESPCLLALNFITADKNPDVVQKVQEDVLLRDKRHDQVRKNSTTTEEDLPVLKELSKSSPINVPLFPREALFYISSSTAEQPKAVLDFAGVLTPARANTLLKDVYTLEAETGWRLRVITKSGSSSTVSGKDLKDLWKPDEKTVIVFGDLSSPNILNFNAGADVIVKLPRQFFLELQSRYGNQFYVQQEGEAAALMSSVQAIQECLSRAKGCKNVPGLTNDLYNLTLVTSIVGGCVFGFAARLPPSGRVEASWQWVVFLSPLWLLLFVSFGVLPVVGRTSELEPLLKNTLGFCVGAVALYLTPIFGPAPISKR